MSADSTIKIVPPSLVEPGPVGQVSGRSIPGDESRVGKSGESSNEDAGAGPKSARNNILHFRITEDSKVIIEVKSPDNDKVLRTIALDELPSPAIGQLIDVLT